MAKKTEKKAAKGVKEEVKVTKSKKAPAAAAKQPAKKDAKKDTSKAQKKQPAKEKAAKQSKKVEKKVPAASSVKPAKKAAPAKTTAAKSSVSPAKKAAAKTSPDKAKSAPAGKEKAPAKKGKAPAEKAAPKAQKGGAKLPSKKEQLKEKNRTAAVPETESEKKTDKDVPASVLQDAENTLLAIEAVLPQEEDSAETAAPRLDDKSRESFTKKYIELMEYARKKDNMLEYQEVIDCFAELRLEDEQYDTVIQHLEDANVEILRVSYEEEDEVPDEELEMIEDDEDLDAESLDLTISDSVNIEDHVRMYLKEIGKVPLLTADEEIDLARRMEKGIVAAKVLSLGNRNMIGYVTKGKNSGIVLKDNQVKAVRALSLTRDEKQLIKGKTERELREMTDDGEYAKNKLAEANLRLVVSIAKRYVGRGMLFLDLIQEGNLGLIKAVEKFDFRKGFKFSTYATWWIRQAITRAIADQARTIRIPVHMVETINKLVRVSRQLLQKLGREPSPEEIAQEMDISVDRVREIIKISQEPVSLETPIGEEEDSHLGDFIQDDNVPVPADAAAFTLLKEQLQEVLGTLTEREQKVLRLRFGLDDGRARTLEEVGKEFNVTRERIRQIEAKALRKLRHPSRSKKLKDYLD